MCMQKTVYFLVHLETGERLRYYRTLAGARIAQRARNYRLGFRDRVERVEVSDNLEAEQYRIDGEILTATWCIAQAEIEQEDWQ
jgi:hypothetical protein